MLDPRPTRRPPVGIFRTSQPSGGVSAREEEGARPNGRMRLLPQVSIVASSSAPRRDVRFGGLRLGMKSRPRGQLATTYATPLAGRERPERPPALPTAPLRRQRGLRPGRLRQRRGALRCGVASMRSTDCWAMANTTRWPAWQALNDRAIERWVLPVPRAEEADFAVLGDPCELCELQGQRLLGAGLGGEVEVRQGLVGWECRGGCAGGAGREPRAAHPRAPQRGGFRPRSSSPTSTSEPRRPAAQRRQCAELHEATELRVVQGAAAAGLADAGQRRPRRWRVS
jgi:hypothetical protein